MCGRVVVKNLGSLALSRGLPIGDAVRNYLESDRFNVSPGMHELHNRWPVALPTAGQEAWLDRTIKAMDLLSLLVPTQDEEVEAYEVGTIRGDGLSLTKPLIH